MLKDLKSTFERSAPTLMQDCLGAVSLVIMLVVGLHLPGLI